MKKFLIATATLVALSSASFADQNTENMNNMDKLRKMKFEMMMQMNDDMMASMKRHEEMLTAYQRVLKQMMENELASH